VNYTSLTPAVCTVSGASVRVLTTGTCSIEANQEGNDFFTVAEPVTQSITVTALPAATPVPTLGTWALALLAASPAMAQDKPAAPPTPDGADIVVTATRFETLTHDEAIARDLKIMDTAAFALARENRLNILVGSAHGEGAITAILKGESKSTLVTP
jgi:hypothetical protein